MNVSNDLCWWSDLLDHDRLRSEHIRDLISQFNDMLSLAWELTAWFDILSFLGLQKWLDEHLTKCVIWVFINLGMILLLRIQLLWLFG